MVDHIKVAGVNIAYEVHGAGEPVLLMASVGMRKEAWRASVAPPLIDAGFRVVTFDTRGIGESDAPPAPYAVADIAADAVGLIESLGIGPCRIVGYSLGGFVAQELALQRPELVRAAALVASAGPITAFGRLVIESALEVAERDVKLPQRKRIKDILAEILTPAQLQDDATVQAWVDMFAALPEWGNPGRHGQYAATLAWVQREGPHVHAAKMSVPLLVVAFEHDIVFPPASGQKLAEATGADLVVIPDAAHGGPFTHAPAVAEQLIDWFRRAQAT